MPSEEANMLDWNVFYSSIAQSTAAFVGLLGAFIITKIINNEQQFNEHKILIEDYIVAGNYLKQKLNDRYFKWYNKRTREQELEDLTDDARKNEDILYEPPESLYKKYRFSEFDNKEEILVAIKEQQGKILRGEDE